MQRLFFLDIFSLIICLIDGTHFLGGTITWHPLNASATGTPVTIVIAQTYSWTYTVMSCTNAMIASNQYVPSFAGAGSQQLICISNCGSGSVGYSSIGVLPRCTDFSNPVDTTVGQRLDNSTLKSGDDFYVAFAAFAWRILATAPGASWSISARINLTPRSDTGLYNNAPVATMMSPINIPVNTSTVINVPVGDADGDDLRCRWSTQSNGVDECGGVCPPGSLPSNTVIYPNCTIVITGQILNAWYAVTLMVEDFIDTTTTVPLSSVPVQFLVHVVQAPTCKTPPEVVGVPVALTCATVTVGQTFTSQLIAINYCAPSVTIVDIATLSFSGMVKGDLAQLNSSEYYKNLTWTPTSAQLGYQVMCAMAFDNASSQSAQYCFKFYVTDTPVCSCPGEPCITTTTTSTTSTTSTSRTTGTTSTTASTSTTSSTTSTSSSSSSSTSTSSTSSTSTSTSSTSSTTSTTSTTSTSTTSTTSTSTSTTSTTSTSTTSTTSTSTTSTTSTSATTTTVTTTTKKPDPINWSLIGGILGLLLLAALTLCSCLWYHYLYPLLSRPLGQANGTIELYHIERCKNPNCHWQDLSTSFGHFSSPPKKYIVYGALNESTSSVPSTQTKLFGSLNSSTMENVNESNAIDFRSDSFLSTTDDRVNYKLMSGVSVTKVKLSDRIGTIGNPGIKSADHSINDGTINFSLKDRENVKISRIKSTAKPTVQSNDVVESVEDRFSKHPSAGSVKIIRVADVPMKSSLVTNESLTQRRRQSTKDDIIRLGIIDETREPSRQSTFVNKNKVNVTLVPSTDRQPGSSGHEPPQPDSNTFSSKVPMTSTSAQLAQQKKKKNDAEKSSGSNVSVARISRKDNTDKSTTHT